MRSAQALSQWRSHHKSCNYVLRASRRGFHVQTAQQCPQSQTAATISDSVSPKQLRAKSHLPRPVSLVGRVIRSIFYVALFGATGFAVAWGYKTWGYLRMGHVIALPATRALTKERFSKRIETSSLVNSLRDDGWIEDTPADQQIPIEHGTNNKIAANRGHHMVNERLTEDGYLVTRSFRHPTENMTVLVFAADFACESWPNTLHGGIATTVIQEALDAHVKHFPGYTPVRNRETTMNYRLPLNPGKVYSVLVRTEGREYPYKTSKGPDESFMGVAVNVLVNQMDCAPRYVESYNEATKAKDRVCKIHNVNKDISAYVQGGSILFLASKQFREMVGKDQSIIPTLQAKLDAWRQSSKLAKLK